MISYAALLFKTKKEEKTDGKVWIKNKKVFIKDEKGLGSKPIICPRQGIKVLVNNTIHESPVTVSAMDKVEIIAEPISREEAIEITISENLAEAWLHTVPSHVVKYEVLDSEPSCRLEVKAFEIFQNVRFIPEESLYAKISEMGINTGIIHEEIANACNTYEEKDMQIAIGIPCVPAKNAWLEYFFSGSEYEINLHENKKGKIDFKNIVDYQCSKVGDILAVKHSLQYGQTGISVTGEIINPGTPNDITLKAGNGIVIEGNGRIARCIKAGKAYKTVNGNIVTISINEALKIDKNVDIRLGNIKFGGSVEINGSVKEAMEVTAKGNVNIIGDSLFSVIKSNSSITIAGNVISSRVETEEVSKLDSTPLKYFEPIIEAIDYITNKIEAYCENEALNPEHVCGIAQKAKEISDSKLPNLNRQIKNLTTMLKSRKYEFLNEKADQMISALKIIQNNCKEIKSIDHLYELRAIIYGPIHIIEEKQQSSGEIGLQYTVNSTIFSAGKVVIGNKGCINCTIQAKGKIAVKGIVRGGKIYSEDSVELTQVGSSTGTSTIISVPENGTIKADKIFSESIIKIGKYSYRFIENTENINAHVQNDKIVLR